MEERIYGTARRSGLRRRRDSVGRFLPTDDFSHGHKDNHGTKRSLKARGASWPIAMFAFHALISFFGIVVVPSRLAYEFLLRPKDGINAIRDGERMGDRSTFIRENAHVPRGRPSTVLAQTIAGERGRLANEVLDKSSAWKSRHEPKGRAGARILMQTSDEEDEESFTYTAKTQFFLCAADVQLDNSTVATAITEVFDVDSSQVLCLGRLLMPDFRNA